MIENFHINMNGICLLVALLAGFIMASLEAKRLKVQSIHFLRLIPMLIIGGIIGARIFFVVFGWDQFEKNTEQMIVIWQGGFAIYGAILMDLLIIWIYAKICHIRSIGKLYDMLALPAALMIAIGRWGDYFTQTSFGERVKFTPKIPFFHIYIERFQEWHMGLFFIESIGCLLIFVVMLIAIRRKKMRRYGDAMLWILALYGGLRSVLESMRQDSLFFGFVRVAQVIGAAMVLLTLGIFSYRAFQKSDRTKKYRIAGVLLLALGLLGAAFWAEFTMGQGLELINRAILAGGILGILVCTYFIYNQTPKKPKCNKQEIVTNENES